MRELIAQHTKSKTCAACHANFDPVGLALENFDIFGAWRTQYRGTSDGEQVTGIDRAGLGIDREEHGAVETVPRGEDSREHRHGFLGAVFLVAGQENDPFPGARTGRVARE